MSDQRRKYCLLILCILILEFCKKPYIPPALQAANNYLVVDGIINTAPNAITTVNVNRTRNLGDSTTEGIPELHAQVSVLSANGNTYPLTDTGNTGHYASGPLILDPSARYAVDITTTDGRHYASDMVTPKATPPIDSLYYDQPDDLTIYVNTHDPAAATHYYRWDYSETWEHDAQLMTVWDVKNGMIFLTDSATQITQCWTTRNSSSILLATSVRLGQDVIDRMPINVVPNGDERINKRYSIAVRQYALTPEAYNYWDLIQKTTDGLGTLFDLQPTRLVGNIRCTTNPTEPVIGFLSASTVQQQRIFVFQSLLNNWKHNSIAYTCDSAQIPVNPLDYRIYTYPDTLLAPFYFISNGPLVLASKQCLDCLLFGGTNTKPSFW